MAMRITEEERALIKDEFLFVNQSIVNQYVSTIIEYWKSKELLSEQQIVNNIFQNYENVERIAGNILFTLATMEEGNKPIQSVGGMISGMMSVTDSKQDRIDAMHTAMELLLVSDPFVEFEWSKNGHPMIKSRICDEEIRTRNVYLPLDRPTNEHKELGSFNWKMTRKVDGKIPEYIYTMDGQNQIGLKIIKLDEVTEIIPDEHDFSKDGVKQREKANKQVARQYLADQYADEEVYFNWAADYRGRVYSVGYYLNAQGSEVEKNMIEFYEGEKLDFHGIQQLKKSIASAYGLDKKNDVEKLRWFIRNESMLHLRIRTAKEPYTFQALLRAYKQWKKDPEAIITTPVELDATNSQTQIMSVLTGNLDLAKRCNVVNDFNENEQEKIGDLYADIADAMSDLFAKYQTQQ